MDLWLIRQGRRWRHALLRMALPLIAALLAHGASAAPLIPSTGSTKCDPTVQSCAPGTGGGISLGGGSGGGSGGSFGTGDLSNVALVWMAEQAQKSGLILKKWIDVGDAQWGKVTNPVLHDKSNAPFIDTNNPDETRSPENSAFFLRDNNAGTRDCTSRREARPGGMVAKESERFIKYRTIPGRDADGSSLITGDINMKEYAQWLKDNYDLTVELQ